MYNNYYEDKNKRINLEPGYFNNNWKELGYLLRKELCQYNRPVAIVNNYNRGIPHIDIYYDKDNFSLFLKRNNEDDYDLCLFSGEYKFARTKEYPLYRISTKELTEYDLSEIALEVENYYSCIK